MKLDAVRHSGQHLPGFDGIAAQVRWKRTPSRHLYVDPSPVEAIVVMANARLTPESRQGQAGEDHQIAVG
jgi:hypothetical protein